MFLRPILVLAVFTTLMSCTPREKEIAMSDVPVPGNDSVSGGAFFTVDEKKIPVLCYTAIKNDTTSLYLVRYDTVAHRFEKPIRVTPSGGTIIHEESMNKVAFRRDGSMVAIWEVKHPTEDNKYAGSILYSISKDNGRSWSVGKTVHADTTKNNSRSFFDVAVLGDGEVAVTWLDSRLKHRKGGSSLYFIKTEASGEFTQEQRIAETVCECCRTESFVGKNGILHIAYRDIDETVNGQVRDIHYIRSDNHGVTFSMPAKLSDDHWIIDGCPHTGASLAERGDTVLATWFTASGHPGVYWTFSTSPADRFSPRTLLSPDARHPQLSSNAGRVTIVWDEATSEVKHHAHSHHNGAGSAAKIQLAWLTDDGKFTTQCIDKTGGSFPVLWTSRQFTLVAYTQNNQVVVKKVVLK